MNVHNSKLEGSPQMTGFLRKVTLKYWVSQGCTDSIVGAPRRVVRWWGQKRSHEPGNQVQILLKMEN